MLVKTRAIVIAAIKYQDKSLIVKCFTQSDGLKTYFVRDAFSAKKSNQKIAYFQPLSILEIEANHKNKGTMESFKELKVAIPYQSIASDIVKNSIVFFVAEFLSNVIKEEQKDEELYLFLETAFQWLDEHDQVANFPIFLMIQLTKYFGIYPSLPDQDELYFQLENGAFTSINSYNCLSESETQLWQKLLLYSLENPQKYFSNNERQLLMRILIEYYTIHISGFRKPKTLEILHEILH